MGWSEVLGTLDDHMCEPAREEDPLAGMAEGDDYQQCPSCKRKITQGEGCNHMICACGAHFCFICGREVSARRSGDWQQGGCPRFGRIKNGSGAFFDQFGYYGDEEDDEELDSDTAREFVRRVALMIRYESIRAFFDRQVIEERRQIDNKANRRSRSRTWMVDAHARGSLYEAISFNLDISYRVIDPHFDDEDAEAVLSEFMARHRGIVQDYRAARDEGQDDGDEAQLSNMSLEFEMYFDAARDTMEELEALQIEHD